MPSVRTESQTVTVESYSTPPDVDFFLAYVVGGKNQHRSVGSPLQRGLQPEIEKPPEGG